MPGNRIGGLKSAAKNKANEPNFYNRIGAIGGGKSKTGGFASTKVGADGLTGRERASIAGVKGGQISRKSTKQDRVLQINKSH